MDQDIANLCRGMALGYVQPRTVLERALVETNAQLPADLKAGAFYAPFKRLGRDIADAALLRYPDGMKLCDELVHQQTTTGMNAAEVHAVGLHGEMQAVMPEFRRAGGYTAFVEGWALHADPSQALAYMFGQMKVTLLR